jgi:hypothetical protein
VSKGRVMHRRPGHAGRRTCWVAPLLALLLAPVAAVGEIVQGVDFDAVPWHDFCSGVESVPLRTDAGDCPVSHPAAARHARYIDFTGRGVEPPPQCGPEASTFERATSPARGKAPTDPAAWGFCRAEWWRALNQRAKEPARFDEPFGAWRARYFGPWIIEGGAP